MDANKETIVFIVIYTAWGNKCERKDVRWAIWMFLRVYLSTWGKTEMLI